MSGLRGGGLCGYLADYCCYRVPGANNRFDTLACVDYSEMVQSGGSWMCWMILRRIIKLCCRVSGVCLAFRDSVCLLRRIIISRGGIQSTIGAFLDSGLGAFIVDIFFHPFMEGEKAIGLYL